MEFSEAPPNVALGGLHTSDGLRPRVTPTLRGLHAESLARLDNVARHGTQNGATGITTTSDKEHGLASSTPNHDQSEARTDALRVRGMVALTKGDGTNVMMGDLLLTEDEVNPLMSALLQNGLDGCCRPLGVNPGMARAGFQ